MRKEIVVMLLVGVLASPALAETPKPPRPEGPRGDPQVRAERLAEQLGLTSDQRQRLSALMEKHLAEARAIRENENLAPEARRSQLSALREQHRAEVGSILTPEQRAHWEAIRQRIRERRSERSDASPAPERPRPPRPAAAQ